MDDEKEKEVDKGTPTSPSTPPSLQDKAMTLLPGVATSAMVMGAGFQGANVLSELLLTSQVQHSR